MTTTRLVLVRHGETDWNATERCQGTTDVPLNERGLSQAEALAAALGDVDFDAAYTSPLERARRTAEIILEGRHLRAASVDGLHEISYGARHGLTPHEWPTGEWNRWSADPWSVTFPDGESLHGVRERAAPLIESIVSAHAGETVLISAHGHLNRVLLIHAGHASPDSFWTIAQPNGGAWIIDYNLNGATRCHEFHR